MDQGIRQNLQKTPPLVFFLKLCETVKPRKKLSYFLQSMEVEKYKRLLSLKLLS